jgi:hypothetical protein
LLSDDIAIRVASLSYVSLLTGSGVSTQTNIAIMYGDT